MYTMTIVVVVVLLVLSSAICSGLNIALMSLKTGDLRRKVKLGDQQAARVLPFRVDSHLSLASILLSNVAVISATSLVLGHILNGFIAGVISTLLIVIFGEVIPQSLFVSSALAYCAFFAPLLEVMVVLTYPISRPLQLLLDRLLGPEHTTLQTRHELGLLIGEHAQNTESELDDDELEIIRGALSLSEKRVRDIMTPIKQVYWLAPDVIVDGSKIDEIKDEGWSRVPVFHQERTEVYGVLMMKDLVDMDFDNHTYVITDLTLHPTQPVGSMTALDTLFRKFISAHSHLMPVEKDGKIIGIVTIEDLIEEIIGHEIEDEGDRPKLQPLIR